MFNKLHFIAMATLSALAIDAIAQSQPADAIAGTWTSDAQFIAKSSDPTPLYFWVGRIDGEITPTGRFTFRAENGCQLTGLLTPIEKPKGKFKGAINITACRYQYMNRTYELEVLRMANSLKLSAHNKLFQDAKLRMVFDISSTLSRR